MNKTIKSLRKNALHLFNTGIAAADPSKAVKDSLIVGENHFEIALDLNDASKKRIGRWSKIHLIAFGKAACSMAQAATEVIPSHRLASRPLAITNYENKTTLTHVNVIAASHPIPDEAGQKATEKVLEKLKSTEAGELVLILISGGGSALLPYPANGISLDDKQTVTDLLLTSSADIKQINCVRKHLSQIKGGQLAKLSLPADCHSLILSDVVGDDLSSIASGPTVPDITTFSEAIDILKKNGIWNKVSANVQTYLGRGVLGEVKETPRSDDLCFSQTSNTIVGDNSISLKEVTLASKRLGYKTDIFSTSLSGEASKIAEQMVLHANTVIGTGLTRPLAILSGGETTVTVKGTGKGGRNQEMALAFAISVEKHPLASHWVFLSGGTDGVDGPTDAAGGMVDSETLNRIKQARANPENRLNNNDSYSALKKSDDLIITGATGTNVADLQILLIQPA